MRRRLPFTDTDAYRNIKVATEAFVMANCGIYTDTFDGSRCAVRYAIRWASPPTSRGWTPPRGHYLKQDVDGATIRACSPYLAHHTRESSTDQRYQGAPTSANVDATASTRDAMWTPATGLLYV